MSVFFFFFVFGSVKTLFPTKSTDSFCDNRKLAQFKNAWKEYMNNHISNKPKLLFQTSSTRDALMYVVPKTPRHPLCDANTVTAALVRRHPKSEVKETPHLRHASLAAIYAGRNNSHPDEPCWAGAGTFGGRVGWRPSFPSATSDGNKCPCEHWRDQPL